MTNTNVGKQVSKRTHAHAHSNSKKIFFIVWSKICWIFDHDRHGQNDQQGFGIQFEGEEKTQEKSGF